MFRKLFSRSLTAITMAALFATMAQASTIETVTVANTGNTADGTGNGAVNYSYNIGKFEVTAGQYVEFLNAVAATDTYGLWTPSMVTDGMGCKVDQHGDNGSHTYVVTDAAYVNRPVNYVSWGDAARYANWLQNGKPTGAQDLSTTEDGAYYLNGVTTSAALNAVTRKADAKWFLPTANEWYKSAYHKNDGNTGNYWDFATKSDYTGGSYPYGGPLAVRDGIPLSSDTNQYAAYSDDHIAPAVMGLGAPYYTTPVDALTHSDSAYGTFGQAGNVWEWTEGLSGGDRRLMGGAYSRGFDMMMSATNYTFDPTANESVFGFRVANVVPEPSTITLLLSSFFGLLIWRRLRNV